MKHPHDITTGSWYSKTLFKGFSLLDCERFLNKNKLNNALIQKCIFSGQFFVTCYTCKECRDLSEVAK